MPRFVPLTDSDRHTFRELQSLADLSQKEVAERITTVSITQPWISQMLGGVRATVDSDILEAYVNQLALVLKSRPLDDRFTAEMRRNAFNFFRRFSQSPALKDPVEATRAGGGVPVDAIYYQPPTDEGEVLKALSGTVFSMLVLGPVQCGKSSLLARLENQASSMGFETAWFDLALPLGQIIQRPDRPTLPTAAVASALYEQVQDQWKLEPRKEGAPETINHLLNWLRRALKATAPKSRLLILDDLSSLGLDGAEEWTSLFTRALCNFSHSESMGLSVAVGMRYVYGAHFERRMAGISSIVHWNPYITLDWFDRSSADRLVDNLDRNALIHEPYKHFLGQPYLTHAFASDKDFREAAINWFAQPDNLQIVSRLKQSKIYRRHLGAIRATFAGRVLELDREDKSFIKAYSTLATLSEDQRKFLHSAKLLNPNDDNYQIPLYGLMAADLASNSEKVTE